MTIYNSNNCTGAKTYDVDSHEYIKGVVSVNTDTGYVHCKDEDGFESIIRFKLILAVPPTGKPTEFHCNSRINEIDETMKEMACICMEKFKAFQAAGFNESQALELCKS